MAVLIQVENVSKHYGVQEVLNEASASFSDNQKIGVVGRNGAGKSTLCRILCGLEEADSGIIHKNRELRLSYLEQHDSFQPGETVTQFLMRFSGREDWECGEVAARFQMKGEILDRPVEALSGGYRTRTKLAAMLLQRPNFLVLDEPTNYLDLSTLILLENFLQDFRGGCLIVSHDREFLKRTCDHTLEIERGEMTLYPGTIEEYFEFKEEQLAQKHAHNRTVEKKKAQLQTFVDRFKAKASMASRARSKMKQIEKLETIEIAHRLDTVRITLPNQERKTGPALTLCDLNIGYPERRVADAISLEIERGEKVAVLGDNGQGKTTFLRTIARELEPLGGSFKWANMLETAYYAQLVFKSLHPEDSVFSHLQRCAANGVTTQDVLDMAGAFLFKGDDVKKKVAVLSGGERARALLAGLLLSKSQVLLLDEPTNHLDFETVEALGRALQGYAGTIFFISHDRTFVNLIATFIVEIKDGRVRKYPGTYQEYVDSLETQARQTQADASVSEASTHLHQKQSQSSGTSDGKKALSDFDAAQKLKQDLKKLQTQAAKLESRVQNLVREKEALGEEIQKNPFHYSRERNEKLKQITLSLENAEAEWLTALDRIEKLNRKLS